MISGIRRWMGGMARPRMGRRIAALCLSVAAMGLCVAVFDRIGLGTDPCSTMNLGLSRKIGLPFGTTQLLVNLLMLIAVLRFDIGRIGMGTIANMVFVGYIAEFGMAVLDRMPDLGALPLGARLAIFVPTMAAFLLAASVYMVVDLGVAPYDAVPQIIARRSGKSFRPVRMAWDIGMMTGGFLLGSTVGLVTMVIAFCLGPMVTWVAGRVAPLFE